MLSMVQASLVADDLGSSQLPVNLEEGQAASLASRQMNKERQMIESNLHIGL